MLRSRAFRLCAKYGQSKQGKFMRIQARHTSFPLTKLGLTVSRRFGKAVHRNRFKRKIREIFRLMQHEFPQYLDLNISPLKPAAQASFHDLKQELTNLITNIH